MTGETNQTPKYIANLFSFTLVPNDESSRSTAPRRMQSRPAKRAHRAVESLHYTVKSGSFQAPPRSCVWGGWDPPMMPDGRSARRGPRGFACFVQMPRRGARRHEEFRKSRQAFKKPPCNPIVSS